MEFIPETLEALDELDPSQDDGRLRDELTRMAALAQAIAPDLAGMSIAYFAQGLTFTLVASAEEIAALDAIQYLDTGPCVEAAERGTGVATTEGGLLSEQGWQDLAVASAAAGVCSTLTFPILAAGEIIGTVNIYGRSEDTFFGKHQALADVLQAWAPGVVTNADLSFSTRDEARHAPDQLRDDAVVDAATGILAAGRGVSVDSAREQLGQASSQAGIPITQLARAIIELHHRKA